MCNYDFNVPVDAEEHGGKTEGQNSHVAFSIPTPVGDLDGTCQVKEPKVISIQVSNKPDLVSCRLIREKLVIYLTEAVRVHSQLSSVG